MTGYIVRRGIASFVVVWVVSVVVFLLIHAAPGDPVLAKLSQRIPESQLQALREQIGIDDPLPVQYFRWLGHTLRGDLGQSLYRDQQTVAGRLADTFPVTAELLILSILFSALVGIPLGVISAARQDSALDYVIRVVSITGLAVPAFWLGTVLIVYGGLWFGYATPDIYVPIWEDPVENLRSFWMPALILGYNLCSITMRFTRSAVLEVLRHDYIRTARAKGLRETTVVIRHVLLNAAIPVIAVLGNQIVFLLGGTVVVEFLFHLPGLGSTSMEALSTRDYNLMLGIVMFVATLTVTANLAADVAAAASDPRIRLR